MKRVFSIITISVCGLLLVALGIGIFALPQQSFSDNENRYLKETPDFSLDALLSGVYTADFEKMCSDQIPLRDFWISARSRVLLASGNIEIGGVYLGDDDFLFESYSTDEVMSKRYEQNLKNVNSFAKSFDGECYVMLVPTASDILPGLLPKYNFQYDTGAVFDKATALLTDLSFVDIRAELEALGKDAYYRTDHHWTMTGAMSAYDAWCCISGVEKREYNLIPVTNKFRGTLYSKVLLSSCAYDTISLPQVSDRITCTANGEEIAMFDMSKLSQKDKYAVLFGGNYGRVDITGGEGEKLLIIKDSYANSFVPYIAEDYSEITMIDLRYFGGSVKSIAKDYDKVLFLYEITNFSQDSNITKVIM